MVNIAFKRAKVSPSLNGVVHPEFITEFADTSLFPADFHKPKDGYEILSKDDFDAEFSKNEHLRVQFEQDRLEKAQLRTKIEQVKDHKKHSDSRKEERKKSREDDNKQKGKR